ncbi:hypothetical protein STEG23_026869, partial [Scotinomys teguina]
KFPFLGLLTATPSNVVEKTFLPQFPDGTSIFLLRHERWKTGNVIESNIWQVLNTCGEVLRGLERLLSQGLQRYQWFLLPQNAVKMPRVEFQVKC